MTTHPTTNAPHAGQAAHTPTPWDHWRDVAGYLAVGSDRQNTVARVSAGTTPLGYANAAFIVRACNSHAALVAALEGLCGAFEATVRYPEEWKRYREARAALAAAKGNT